MSEMSHLSHTINYFKLINELVVCFLNIFLRSWGCGGNFEWVDIYFMFFFSAAFLCGGRRRDQSCTGYLAMVLLWMQPGLELTTSGF